MPRLVVALRRGGDVSGWLPLLAQPAGGDLGRRGGYEGKPYAVMLLVVDLVGFDPAVGAGRFSPLGPLGICAPASSFCTKLV